MHGARKPLGEKRDVENAKNNDERQVHDGVQSQARLASRTSRNGRRA
jgi:hypothetical protein